MRRLNYNQEFNGERDNAGECIQEAVCPRASPERNSLEAYSRGGKWGAGQAGEIRKGGSRKISPVQGWLSVIAGALDESSRLQP